MVFKRIKPCHVARQDVALGDVDVVAEPVTPPRTMRCSSCQQWNLFMRCSCRRCAYDIIVGECCQMLCRGRAGDGEKAVQRLRCSGDAFAQIATHTVMLCLCQRCNGRIGQHIATVGAQHAVVPAHAPTQKFIMFKHKVHDPKIGSCMSCHKGRNAPNCAFENVDTTAFCVINRRKPAVGMAQNYRVNTACLDQRIGCAIVTIVTIRKANTHMCKRYDNHMCKRYDNVGSCGPELFGCVDSRLGLITGNRCITEMMFVPCSTLLGQHRDQPK